MPSYDEWQRILSNPETNTQNMSLAQVLQSVAPVVPPKSKLEQKTERLAQRAAEKSSSLGIGIGQGAFAPISSGVGDTGLGDLFESSVYRASGNIADLGRDVSNKLLNTNFDSDPNTGYSNPEIADREAGVTQAYRDQLSQEQDQVLQNVAEGDWLGAIGSTFNVAARTAADSGGSLVELGAGAILSPLAGSGTALLARRAAKGKKTAENIIKRYNEIKNNPAGKALDKLATETGKASLLTADIVQQQRNEYKALNNGEEMSAGRLAGSTLLTLATTVWTPMMASKLFLPRVKLKSNKKDGNFRERVSIEINNLVRQSERAILPKLASTVGQGISNVAKAGGAEAVQEYAQFWAGALGVQMKPDEKTGFFQAALDVFNAEGNSDLAIQSAFLGAGAGGATKAAIDAPGNTLKTAMNLSASTSKSLGEYGLNQVKKAASASVTEETAAKNRARVRASKKFSEDVVSTAEEINKASKFEDIQNNSLAASTVQEIADKLEVDITDPEVFESLKNETIRNLKSKAASATIASRAAAGKDTVVDVGKKAVEVVGDTTKAVAETLLTEEEIEKVKNLPKTVKEKIISEYENIPQSTTVGLLESAAKYSSNKSKEGLAALRKQARDAGEEATKKMAEMFDTPETKDVHKALVESYKKQKASNTNLAGDSSKKLTDSNSLPGIIQNAAQQGITKDTIDQTMVEIFDTANGQFADVQSAKVTLKAVNKIIESPQFRGLKEKDSKPFIALKQKIDKKVKDIINTEPEPKPEPKAETKKKTPKESSKSAKKARTYLNEIFKVTAPGATKLGELYEAGKSATVEGYIQVKNSLEDVIDNVRAEVVGTIKITPEVENFAKSIAEAQDKAEKSGKVKPYATLLKMLTLPESVSQIIKMIGTDNPYAIESFAIHVAPDLKEDIYLKNLRKSISEVTNANSKKESGNVEAFEISEKDKKKQEDYDKLSEKEKENLKTVEIDEDTNLSESKYDPSKVRVVIKEEENTFIIKTLPKTKEEIKKITEMFTVCGKDK